MKDTMKMLLGYDPDEVVAESVRAARVAISDMFTKVGTLVDAAAGDVEKQELCRIIQSLCGNLVATQHQIAALVLRPAGDTMWPARKIYEGIQGAYADELQSRVSPEAEEKR